MKTAAGEDEGTGDGESDAAGAAMGDAPTGDWTTDPSGRKPKWPIRKPRSTSPRPPTTIVRFQGNRRDGPWTDVGAVESGWGTSGTRAWKADSSGSSATTSSTSRPDHGGVWMCAAAARR